MNIVTYLINLDGSDDRLTQASQQLNHAHIPFTRIAAFDGRALDPNTLSHYDSLKAQHYMGRALKGGELGCYFSHVACVKAFLESNAQYALVLEDDMQLTENSNAILKNILVWLEQNHIGWYLLHIAANKRKIYTTITTIDDRELMHAHYFPMTTTGLVWSRQGAQAFIQEQGSIFAPIDNYLRWWLTKNNKGLSVWPALVTTTGAQSDIDGQTIKRKNNGRNLKYGLAKQKRLWLDKITAFYHKWFNEHG